ncbi:hypothetical protein [Gaoshiqia sediminis]|uniref:Uncharacterized protein n=1 Tax=Gaoshiqia sediminis TaxID=2986998 RepID=A0AA41YF48_9BACT|nr:hypothetical protein [Gaoshiqia sediminis]MCW0484962.1 hypothetical protein [Gaoshiqia sediminis]
MKETTIDKQKELARFALTTDNEEVIDKVLRYARKLMGKKQKLPCQYTIEEVKEGIKKSIDEVAEGKTISYEDVLKRYGL